LNFLAKKYPNKVFLQPLFSGSDDVAPAIHEEEELFHLQEHGPDRRPSGSEPAGTSFRMKKTPEPANPQNKTGGGTAPSLFFAPLKIDCV